MAIPALMRQAASERKLEMSKVKSYALNNGQSFVASTEDAPEAYSLDNGQAYVRTGNGYEIDIIDHGYGSKVGLYEIAWWKDNGQMSVLGWLDGQAISVAIAAIAHGITSQHDVEDKVAEDENSAR